MVCVRLDRHVNINFFESHNDFIAPTKFTLMTAVGGNSFRPSRLRNNSQNSFVGCLNGLLLNNYCMNIKNLSNDLSLQRWKKRTKENWLKGKNSKKLIEKRRTKKWDWRGERWEQKIIYWFESVCVCSSIGWLICLWFFIQKYNKKTSFIKVSHCKKI